MRMMMKVAIPVDAGNKGVTGGGLGKTVARFVEQAKPESSYFVADNGKRTAYFFFDLKDPSDLPSFAEPFFMELNAAIEVTPAMNLADMKAGVERATKNL